MKIRYCYQDIDVEIAKKCKTDYFEIAANVAKKSTMIQKHGCVIVHKKQILAMACNEMPCSFADSIHAEINAINKIKHMRDILKKCEMYVVRVGPDSMNNPLKYSKPCLNCTRYIQSFGIPKIYYSTNYERDLFTFNHPIDCKLLQCQNHYNDAIC